MKTVLSYLLSSLQFIQVIQLHQIHYKSKMPIGYRISRSTIYTDTYA